MSINLGGILDTVSPIVTGVLDTSGTVVDIIRALHLLDGATVDPVTLQITDPTPEAPLDSDVSALISPTGAGVRPWAPQTAQTPGDYVVQVPATLTDVAVRDIVLVTQCRDEALIGARLRIMSIEASGAGMLRALHCIIDVVPA